MKIAFLTVMPSPYVQDVFEALSRDPRCDIAVFYLDHEADNTSWGKPALPDFARILTGSWFRLGGSRIHYNRSAIRELRGANADVYVVGGYPGLTNQSVMYWLKSTRRPWVFWGELPGMRSLGAFATGLRRLAQRPIASANAIAAVGTRAVREYRRLLETRGRQVPVFDVPYHCATEAFTREAAHRGCQPAKGVRFLYCGQLIDRKGVDLLLSAFLQLRQRHNEIYLDLVGKGPLEAKLKQWIPEQFRTSINFHGFRDVCELPKLFAAADVFILPSRHDGWGVVVNQAVASGLPVISTSAVGAAHDLVLDGESGYIVAPGSSEPLRKAMEKFIVDPDRVRRFGKQSFEMTNRISLERAVEDWLEVCSTALANSKVTSNLKCNG